MNGSKAEKEVRNSSIERLAANYYIDLPYHNFDHALKAANVGLIISKRCLQEGLSINPSVVYYALLFHDAGYHENSKQKGFQTKEEYSAFLAGEALTISGIDENLVSQVKKAIISTNRDGTFTTNEEKVVRAADLAEMAADYSQFLNNNKKLKEEAELLGGKKISWEKWKLSTENTIEFYLKQDIHLTTAYLDSDGQSIFHKKAKANLDKFLLEPLENY
jgi:predicted metal-dependent HD superfamily phosphohydrolase